MAALTERVPPELQHLLMKYQQLQEQYATVTTERTAVESELRETQRVIEELNKLEDNATVYKAAGMVLYRANKEDVVKELSERKELLELRLRALRKQEELLKNQLAETQRRIKELSERSVRLQRGG